MPPPLAAAICLIFILYVFWADRKNAKGFSAALWIPQVWMYISGSRELTLWFNLGSGRTAEDVMLEGNPVDRALFFFLMMAGTLVLILRRRVSWEKTLTKNWVVWLYFLFGAISVLWSEYPSVSLKRLLKAIGNIIMALIVLTEPRPYEAIVLVLRRLGMLLLPLSILFIKYYPQWGRSYHPLGGTMFTGVAGSKNGLGQLCLLVGIAICWMLIVRSKEEPSGSGKTTARLNAVFLLMTTWLLYMSNSATSQVCLLVSVGILFASRLSSFSRSPQRLFGLGLAVALAFGFLMFGLDLQGHILKMLGRDPTLTTRTPMWHDLLKLAGDPLLGVGFESFWLGTRLDVIWESWPGFRQAHNGYLEVYLNLGLVGLLVIGLSICGTLIAVSKQMRIDYPAAVLRLCFVVTVILYSWTEATFYGTNNMWTLFLLGSITVPTLDPTRVGNSGHWHQT